MAPHAYLIGHTVGRLTVVALAPTPPGRKGLYWLCECLCGGTAVRPTFALRGKRPTRSCGCLALEDHGPLDLTGAVQPPPGRLTAVATAGSDGRNRLWLCRCRCGGTRTVTAAGFRNLRWTSCGGCPRRRKGEG